MRTSTPKQPSRRSLDLIVSQFNQHFPVGSECMLRTDSGERRVKVRSAAYVLSGHSAVAFFEGISGAYSIEDTRVRAVPVAETAS